MSNWLVDRVEKQNRSMARTTINNIFAICFIYATYKLATSDVDSIFPLHLAHKLHKQNVAIAKFGYATINNEINVLTHFSYINLGEIP